MKYITFLSAILLSALFIFPAASVNAAITGTEVSAGMKIEAYAPDYTYFTDVEGTQIDATSASVSLEGDQTSATTHSSWQITDLGNSSATLSVDFGYAGSGVCDPTWDHDCDRLLPSYMGHSGIYDNSAKIYYSADSDSEMSFSWDLSAEGRFRTDTADGYYYTYNNTPFFSITLLLYEDGHQHNPSLYNFSQDIGLAGEQTWDITAGSEYYLYIYANPNISGGGLDRTASRTYGTMNIDFGQTVVPEPISSMLFLMGGAVMGFRRIGKRVS